jgi:glutamine synthetase
MLAVPDLSGIVRGKSFGAHRLQDVLEKGLAWVPANILISPFSTLPVDNPFGPTGEIGLRMTGTAAVRLPDTPTAPATDLYLADMTDETGAPWDACPRTALRAAVARLRAETGLTMKVAFEHEFMLLGGPFGRDPAFSLAAIRRAGHVAAEIDARLAEAGMPIEQIVPEYGAGQYEIASTPQDPLTACDQAVIAREVIRDVARAAGYHATFVPKIAADAPGNGVHLHASLWRGDTPVLARDGWLTREGGEFAAGLLAHAAALMVFTTGSANSFRRIKPRSWVGAFTCVGTRNREAMIRFCPRGGRSGDLPGASVEFRVVDATANVYLAMAALIHAGLDGLMRDLPAPPDIEGDPSGLPEYAARAAGVMLLPASLDEAIAALQADAAMKGFMPRLLIDALLSVRRNDLSAAATPDADGLAKRLSLVY